jgi:hypothetical protein
MALVGIKTNEKRNILTGLVPHPCLRPANIEPDIPALLSGRTQCHFSHWTVKYMNLMIIALRLADNTDGTHKFLYFI